MRTCHARLSFAPLETYLRLRIRDRGSLPVIYPPEKTWAAKSAKPHHHENEHDVQSWYPEQRDWSDRILARHLGVHLRNIDRYRRDGLSAVQADRLACHLGLHPVELWGQDWEELSQYGPRTGAPLFELVCICRVPNPDGVGECRNCRRLAG